MNLVVRRRLAAGAVLASSALVAGMLLATSSQAAAGGVSVNPSTAQNSDKAAVLNFHTTDADMMFGAKATFTRVGGGQPFVVTIARPTPPSPFAVHDSSATVDFTDMDDGVGKDGPIDAGVYNVSVTGNPDPATGSTALGGGGQDTCTSCFTVLPAGPVAVSSITPTSLRPGASHNVTVAGNNFERGVKIEFLFSDGSVDPLITATAAPKDTADPPADIVKGITTRVQIMRTAKVDPVDAPGKRGMRITNLDGNTATCSGCFFVSGPVLTGLSPTGGVNDPGTSVTVTFTGSNVVDGEPRLEFTGPPGGSSRDALTLLGTKAGPSNGQSMTATFDLSNAAPGPYQGVIRDDASGITNACEQPACPAFTVLQQASRKPPTLTGLDRDPNTAGNQKDQAAGTTQIFDVAGTNFSKGVAIKILDTGKTTAAVGITVTSVEFVSPTLVRATIATAKTATTGDYDVTATLTDGTASAVCSKCYTVGATTSPPASSTTSPSSNPCPTPSATASPSASSTSTISPSPGSTVSPSASSTSGSGGCTKLTISVSPEDIVPTEASTVSVHGSPNQPVQVYAYSRPSATYGLVREGKTDASGDISWTVTPGGNTRLYAHYTSGTTTTNATSDSESTVITVHTSLSLSAYRDGARKYHFQGTNLPRRAGQLITLYRYATGPNNDKYCVPTAEDDTFAKDDGDCHAIITSQAKTGPNNTWRIDRVFNGDGKFYFVVRTSKNINNGRGHSNQRLTIVH